MKKFQKFYFENIRFDEETLEAIFLYSFDEEKFFEEKIFFPKEYLKRDKIDKNIVENILFHMSLALGISYYKLFPTEQLIVKTGYLSDTEIKFWKKFYLQGLGEFLYKNNISPEGLFQFKGIGEKKNLSENKFVLSEKILLPVGGGKDSAVSAELLGEKKADITPFIFGKIDRIKDDFLAEYEKKALLVKRELPQNLFEMNKQGYYNGHVPITGIISFVMLLVAYLSDNKYIVFSNELSAESGNLKFCDIEVNHQYSKSAEFENDFKEYITNNIFIDVQYFSLLRGMYEIKIAQYFAKLGKKYFSVFSSCNNNFKIVEKGNAREKIWCNACPKCLFVFTILRPFLSFQEVMQIFGKDLFERKDLEKDFSELMGISGNKPFECVGEVEEVLLAMKKSLKLYDKKPYILELFETEVLQKKSETYFAVLEEKYFGEYADNIPGSIKNIIQEKIK